MTPALLSLLAAVAAPPASPRAVVHPVGLADARWAAGFWADRFAVCRDATIPAMGQLFDGTAKSQFWHNFRIAAGEATGTHRGPPWNDGDSYKWLEAAAAVFAVTRDPALDRKMDECVALVARAQRADGYLHTPVLIRERRGDPGPGPFGDRFDFEMYNLGHLMTAAVVHREATGKDSLMLVARKAADFLVKVFANPTPQLARNAVCPSHYMGVLDLYRATGDRRYLALAKKFLDLREAVADGTDDNQDRVPFRKQTEAVGHAVRANYLFAGAADLYLETGDPTLLAPLEKVWADVVGKKLYVTGACGALYDGASPDGSKDQSKIARVHQAYGRAYQLPNATAHNETCAAVGNVLWNWRMLRATGDAKYADVLERSLLNGVLCGVSLDGTRFFYTNTLRQLDTMPAPLRWPRKREEWISCYCCPPNVARTVAESAGFAYGRSDRGVWVHLYGGGSLDTEAAGGRVKLTQTTDHPWDGRVTIKVESAPADPFALFLRVPGWATGATLRVNGGPAEAVPAGKYAERTRAWKAGDIVELDLPMAAKRLEAHPLVEEARNHLAVARGPVVYCLESPDLPAGVPLSAVTLPAGGELRPRFDPKLLGGVAVLEGKAEAKAGPTWGGELYREASANGSKAIDVKLVPYFAWGNRGPSEMTVWVPRTP